VKYSRFEELPVWQDAIELAVKIYELTGRPAFNRQYSLRDQLERSGVSVSNNIAEGFERGTTQELLTFLYIARGSCGEVRSMLCLLERLPRFDNLKFEISDFKLSKRGKRSSKQSIDRTSPQEPRAMYRKVRSSGVVPLSKPSASCLKPKHRLVLVDPVNYTAG